ncbi:UNVERIFIED_CONTAM: hypothetical protein Sangu_2514200 [Sesamum angustifolium]|uniref:Uncharacterized protein n=1 Tax=Sesamum angustifolium TaxID=2727405 RepID=A0AAW2JKT2_9LAMI
MFIEGGGDGELNRSLIQFEYLYSIDLNKNLSGGWAPVAAQIWGGDDSMSPPRAHPYSAGGGGREEEAEVWDGGPKTEAEGCR